MDKRETIIFAAIKRFKHYGISKTTMQEIASDADLAVGTLYLYFKNKDEIVVACAQEFAKVHQKIAEEILNSDISGSEKIKKYIIHRFQANQETRHGSPHDFEITKAVIKLNPNRLLEESQWFYENILKILKDGIKNGEFKIEDPEEDTQMFLYGITFFFPLASNYIFKEPEESELIRVINWFIKKWKRD